MQLTLEGKGIDELAMERMRIFEPPEGYYLAFSGGKDSVTLLALAKAAGVKFEARYHLATVDPPEVVRFVRERHPEVQIVRPPRSIWQLCTEPAQGILPTRTRRWCCELLKEIGGQGRYVLTGLRWAESARRARRKMVEHSRPSPTKKFVNPIIDWSDDDVWQYIREKHIEYCPLYDEGFQRIGCVLCPMVEGWQLDLQVQRWPKIVQAWRSAANRVYAFRRDRGLPVHWASGDEYFDWWLSRKGMKHETGQTTFYDCLAPFSD